MFRDRDGWRVQWVDHGKRRSKKFADPKAARRFELELELGAADTAPSAKTCPTFSAFAETYLRDHCRVNKAPSQWTADKRCIELHLIPAFGGVKLVNLRKAQLVAFRGELARTTAQRRGRTLSPKSVNLILGLAKKMLGVAVDLGILEVNPWQSVKPIPTRETAFDYWTPAERDTFIQRAGRIDPDFADFVLVACHTGLRLGELAALRYNDVDLPRRLIRVDETMDVSTGEVYQATKNRTVGYVPINGAVADVLTRRGAIDTTAFVFDRAHVWNARKRLDKLARACGVRSIRFHDLRHTFASALAMAGVDLLVIQKLCRHKSYQMTLRYSHLHPDHIAGATEVLCTQNARTVWVSEKSGGPTRT